jgi:hypothetical protein
MPDPRKCSLTSDARRSELTARYLKGDLEMRSIFELGHSRIQVLARPSLLGGMSSVSWERLAPLYGLAQCVKIEGRKFALA